MKESFALLMASTHRSECPQCSTSYPYGGTHEFSAKYHKKSV